MVNFDSNETFKGIDDAILNEDEGEKKSESNKKSDFLLMLFSALAIISLFAWTFTHYLY